MKAIHSGTAVNASEKLCTVSASSATDPLMKTTMSWSTAVAPNPTKLILTALMPWPLDSMASSIESLTSWLCGTKRPWKNPFSPVGCTW